MCPSGNATIHEEVSFLSGLVGALIGALTGEMYAPTTVEVRSDDRSTDLAFNTADVKRIVTSPEFVRWVRATVPGATSVRHK